MRGLGDPASEEKEKISLFFLRNLLLNIVCPLTFAVWNLVDFLRLKTSDVGNILNIDAILMSISEVLSQDILHRSGDKYMYYGKL